MRLLLSETVELGQFNEVPPYAILSHTWGDEAEEVIFQDIQNNNHNSPTTTSKPGYQKVHNTCMRAAADGLDHVWIDSCCIDKTSSAELSEALNSMYYWYQQAEVCYVYLVDVPSGADETVFAGSKWFTRGWTLQELIAPSNMIFLSSDWKEIGTKWDLREVVSKITGIPVNILLGDDPGLASIAQRMSWAANRVTKKVEDRAYSLMGLFGVNMPLLYGERERAFLRLQDEIMKGSNDHSIFAWTTSGDHGGPLATSPAAFANSGDIVPVDPYNTIGNYPIVRNQGIQLTVPFVGTEEKAVGLAMLECTKSSNRDLKVAVYLRDVSLAMRQFERARCAELELVNPKKFHSLIYPARRLYIRSDGPKKRVLSERPEICVIDLQGTQTSNVYFQPTWKLSSSALTANISTTNGTFCRIVALSIDGVLFRVLLNKNGGDFSAEIETDYTSHGEEPRKQEQGQTMARQVSKEVTREVARKTHVSVAIQKRQRQDNLLWTVCITYQSPRCDSSSVEMQFKHMMVLGEGSEDDEFLFAAGYGLEEIIMHLLKNTDVNSRDARGCTPIIRATEEGHINVFKILHENGAQLESVDYEGQSALHYAAANGHAEILSRLLSQGKVDINSNDDYLWTPLAHAAANGHDIIVQLLLEQPAIALDTRDKCQRTPLLQAARHGPITVVDLLLRAGSDLNAQDQDGMTPLSFAANNGHEEVLEKILQTGKMNDVLTSQSGDSPLFLAAKNGHMSIINQLSNVNELPEDDRAAILEIAARNGHVDVLKKLLETNINVYTGYEHGSTVLHLAAENGHRDIVKMLLTDTMIDPDLKNKRGITPLHAATRNGHVAIVHDLLSMGNVHADCKDVNGMNALQLAALHGNKWLVWLLLTRKDVDINYQDLKGMTALHLAVHSGNWRIVHLLLARAGVDPDIRDFQGKSPLSSAAGRGHVNIVTQLLESGRVDPNSTDKNGITPLMSAAMNGHEHTVKLLIEPGRVDTDSRDSTGKTPLCYAASSGHHGVVRQLLQLGKVDADSRDKVGKTPLCYAALFGHNAVVTELLKTGKTDVNSKDLLGNTPLSYAISSGDQMIVAEMLKIDAVDLEYKDSHGNTPFWRALFSGNYLATREFLRTGKANLEDPEKHGLKPVWWAMVHGTNEVSQELLEARNLDMESRSLDGRTLLHCAARHGRAEIVKVLLVKHKVNPDPKDDYGRTPLWLAVGLGHQEVVKILLEIGKCNPNCEGIHETTPLHVAASKGNIGMVREILATGRADLWKKDFHSRTPMQMTKSNGHPEVVKELETVSKHNSNDASPSPYKATKSEFSKFTKKASETDSVKVDEKAPKKSLLQRILK